MKVNLKCPNCNHETTGNVWTDYGMTFVEDAEGCSVCPECHDLDTDIAFDWLIGNETEVQL